MIKKILFSLFAVGCLLGATHFVNPASHQSASSQIQPNSGRGSIGP